MNAEQGHRELPTYKKELDAAIAAVIRASKLTEKIHSSIRAGNSELAGTTTKDDDSPVTIADYGAQAVINAILGSKFPDDAIVAEEDSSSFGNKSTLDLKSKVWNLVSSTLEEISSEEIEKEGGLIRNGDEMVAMIDKGNSRGGPAGRKCQGKTPNFRILDNRSYRWNSGICERGSVCAMYSLNC